MRAYRLVLVVLVFGVSACANGRTSIGTVERLDTHIDVGADGDLRVRDVFTITPDATGATAFHHEIAGPYSDGVVFAAASIDDVPVEPGMAGLTVDSNDVRIVVRWEAAAVERPTRLAIDYGVRAAVAVREPRGRLAWPVLVPGRAFDVGAVDIALELPEGVRTYDGTGMAEADWIVELTPRGMTARGGHIRADQSATLLAVFDIDRARVTEPDWEWNLDQQRQYFLALVAAAMFILIVGAGVLVQMRVQYPPPPVGAPADVLAASRATRQGLARGLVISAAVAFAFALVCAWLARAFLPGLTPLVHVIPGSIAVVAALFLVAAWWYRLGAPSTR